MARVLCVLPAQGFDPSEAALPWSILTDAGHDCVFATQDGVIAAADPITLDGDGLGPSLGFLMCRPESRALYGRMISSKSFRAPIDWAAVDPARFDALLLPGGHAPGMKPYLESPVVQAICRHFFARTAPVAAICHGVIPLARAKRDDGRALLHGYRTTALTRWQEDFAVALTRRRLGDHYRTYAGTSVEAEVRAALAAPRDFEPGPLLPRYGSAQHPDRGFIVRDRHYLSARFPGDAWKLGCALRDMLG